MKDYLIILISAAYMFTLMVAYFWHQDNLKLEALKYGGEFKTNNCGGW